MVLFQTEAVSAGGHGSTHNRLFNFHARAPTICRHLDTSHPPAPPQHRGCATRSQILDFQGFTAVSSAWMLAVRRLSFRYVWVVVGTGCCPPRDG